MLMKHTFRLYSLLMLLVCTVSHLEAQQNSIGNYEIVVPDKANAVEKTAAGNLASFISKSAHASLALVPESSAKGNHLIFVGNTKAAQSAGITKGVNNDGFAIVAKNGTFFIAGIEDKGTLYGTNAFLETFLGIDYLTSGVVWMPDAKSISLPQTYNVISNPAFITRDNFTDMGFNSRWTNDKNYSGGYKDWHRINHVFSNWDKESDWGLFGHTFFTLVPPSTYFASHPEYYSLIGGKRQKQQLNLSNPEVANIVIQNLKKQMQANPSKTYWMVGQEDMGSFCECDDCTKAYKKYGGQQSGLMIEFINKIAKVFPDKQIATFAYKQTEEPPQNIKPDANVIVVSAPIRAHHNVPLSSPENSKYANFIRQWGTLTNNQMIWDYYANFMDILTPYPNLEVISPNFRFYQSVHAKHIFAQRPVFLNGSEMEELKAYLISKLLWNPQLNQDSIVGSFTKKYYGAAAPYIVQYLDALHTNMQKSNAVLQTQEDALNYSNTFLAPSFIRQYYQIFDQAANAVKSDPMLLNRVNDARLSLDYYAVKLLQSKGTASLGNLSNASKQELRQRFKSSVSRLKVKYAADAKQQPIDKYLQDFSPTHPAQPVAFTLAAAIPGCSRFIF